MEDKEQETMDEGDSEESNKSKTKELSEFEKELRALPENAQRAIRRFRSFIKKCLREDAVEISSSLRGNSFYSIFTADIYSVNLSQDPSYILSIFVRMFMTPEETKSYGKIVKDLVVNKNYFLPKVELKVKYRKSWAKKIK